MSRPNGLGAHARWGYAIVGALALLVLVWGAMAQISGAVVAPGRLAVESSVKTVQHKEGGIVSRILVREGDYVRAGAPLVQLDAALAGANLAMVENQLMQLSARRLRLEAEQVGAVSLAKSSDQFEGQGFQAMLRNEARLLQVRRSMLDQQQARMAEQVRQTEQEIDGMQAELTSLTAQRRLIDGELTGIRRLYDKGLAPLSRLNALERQAEEINGRQGQLEAAVARARTRISEIRLQILQARSEHLAQVMGELKETEITLAKLREQRTVGQDQLRRVEVAAPTSGYVQELAVHTVGGVVAPGETLMRIVPEKDALIVEARVDPQHIDQVEQGRTAHIRFTSFSAQRTPEVIGRVDRVSADAQVDERTGASFYVALLRLDRPSLPKGLSDQLMPGMPAEVQIETVRRSALSYFLKPLSDQFNRAFRED